MARPPIESDVIYHVYNRGVDGREIFMDDGDRIRFLHHLYFCNDINHKLKNFTYYCTRNKGDDDIALRTFARAPHKPLVELMVFALMPNHYHLMLRQVVERGISRFMHALGTAYTNFFNEKYERSGSLFQSKYKYVPVTEDGHLIHLPHYIHLNPLPVVAEQGLVSGVEAWERLLEYRWSSLRDYQGKHNYPSLIEQRFVAELFGTREQYQRDVRASALAWGDVNDTNLPSALRLE